ncbi:MAG: hypothetical protein R3293_28120 [Candidatus Promineifilaceae bacterium]|nr:hypothetical protein [Candidatus Promineifilaceae bacterium]
MKAVLAEALEGVQAFKELARETIHYLRRQLHRLLSSLELL